MASQDRKEFDKYLKFLTYKVAQVVIQSKQGRKIRTKSMPHGNEWFNVTIHDDKQVSNELKRSLEGHLPQQDCPVCVEISMETLEGDSLVLEVWSVAIDYSKRDIGVSVTNLLYPRISLMLKSLIALSRTTPSYRLSRQQEDNLKFKIYAKAPQNIKGFKTVEFTRTTCPYGTIALSLIYCENIVFPDRNEPRIPQVSLQGEQEGKTLRGKEVQGSITGHSMVFPFAPVDTATTEHSLGTAQLFSAILPRPTESAPTSLSSLSSHRQNSGNSNNEQYSYSREDSDQAYYTGLQKEGESFIMVDMEKIKPVFAGTDEEDEEELGHLLHLGTEMPDLDMFSGEGSTDVTTAMRIIENQS